MRGRFVIAAVVGVVLIVVGAGAAYGWLIPGPVERADRTGTSRNQSRHMVLHRSVPAKAKAQPTRLAKIRRKLRQAVNYSGKNARLPRL